MIEGLERALEEHRQPALSELAGALKEALGTNGPARLSDLEKLKSRIFRLRVETAGGVTSLVIKRMEPQTARRNERVIRQWLPQAGFTAITPALLGIGAERSGGCVWHVYEDIGAWMLDPTAPDPARVAEAVRLIARIHARFGAHPTLAECRLDGENLGLAFFSSNVRDAVYALEALRPPNLTPNASETAVRDRLLARLHRLLDEEPLRARALADGGGPETLLHGDLWTTNTFVEPTADGYRVRLIDWDHAGVGSASYDLSTFLLRFDASFRAWILERYREASDGGPWHMPDVHVLNLLFETAECARYANRVIWPALALLKERVAWGFDELAAIEGWFEDLRPVLPGAAA